MIRSATSAVSAPVGTHDEERLFFSVRACGVCGGRRDENPGPWVLFAGVRPASSIHPSILGVLEDEGGCDGAGAYVGVAHRAVVRRAQCVCACQLGEMMDGRY